MSDQHKNDAGVAVVGIDAAELLRPVRLRTGVLASLFGIWYRHYRVYGRTLLANATPPVLEPLFFFAAIGLGLGTYLGGEVFEGLPYRTFVASGLVIASAMFTSVFETTYSTFVRLVYQRTYDAMLGTHLRVGEIFTGEMLFCATKGAVFASVVLLVTLGFGVRVTPWCLLLPIVGFLTGYLFAAVGLIVTRYVKTINNFSFFTTGVVTPLFFFSGTFFPVRGHNWAIDLLWWLMPLTHPIELARGLFRAEFPPVLLAHLAVLAAWTITCHVLALRLMRQRVLK